MTQLGHEEGRILDPNTAGHLLAGTVRDVITAAGPRDTQEVLATANADMAGSGLKVVSTREENVQRAERLAHLVDMGIIDLGKRSADLERSEYIVKQIAFAELILNIQDRIPARPSDLRYDGTPESYRQVRQHDRQRYIRILGSPAFKAAVIRAHRG